METIIGLGGAGCSIAKAFERYPQYSTYLIDTENHKNKNSFLMKKQDSHEEYEKNCPDLRSFFSSVSGPCLFVLGAGKISGASLAVLSQLRQHPISLLYIHPDEDCMMGEPGLLHSTVFGVLQEYTRSGMFEKMYIVQNSMLESVLQEVPVIGYHDKLNNFLVDTIHMVNVFNNTKAEFSTFRDVAPAARISTFGVVDVEKNEEKLFFSLTMPREKRYYYGINRGQLETDGSFLRDLKDKMKEKLDGKTRISYGIYSTEYENSYGYVSCFSSLIQRPEYQQEDNV